MNTLNKNNRRPHTRGSAMHSFLHTTSTRLHNRLNVSRDRSASGFTLTEVLVTVIILTILAVIAVLLFSGQSAKAQSGVARTDVAVVGESLARYTSETNKQGVRKDVGKVVLTSDVGTVEVPTSPNTKVYVWVRNGGVDSARDITTENPGVVYDAPNWWCVEKTGGGDVWSMTPDNTTPVNTPCDLSDLLPGNSDGPANGGAAPPPPAEPTEPPTTAVTLAKGGMVNVGGNWVYQLTWDESPEYGVDGYVVYQVSPNHTGAIFGTAGIPGDAGVPYWAVATNGTITDPGTTEYTFTPGDMTNDQASNAGSWKAFAVRPYNEHGLGPVSNKLTVSDGWRSGGGSLIGCAVTSGPDSGKVLVVMQVPDTWRELRGPVDWQLRNSSGTVTYGSGTGTGTGVFPVYVPNGVTIGQMRVVDADGDVYTRTVTSGTVNYTSKLASAGACPVS